MAVWPGIVLALGRGCHREGEGGKWTSGEGKPAGVTKTASVSECRTEAGNRLVTPLSLTISCFRNVWLALVNGSKIAQ
jgi:hypothetical protein